MRTGFVLCLVLAGCVAGNTESPQDAANDLQPIRFDQYLWRAARESVASMPVSAEEPLLGVIRTDWAMPLGATNADEYRTDIQLDYGAPYAGAAAVTVYHRAPGIDAAYDLAPSLSLQRAIARYADELRGEGNAVN